MSCKQQRLHERDNCCQRSPLLLIVASAVSAGVAWQLSPYRCVQWQLPPVAYRFLTDEGIEFLRTYLNLPAEIVPATLKKSTRPLERDTRGPGRFGGDRPPRREGGFGGDR